MMNSLLVIIFTTIIVVGTSAPVENNHEVCRCHILTVLPESKVYKLCIQHTRLHVTRGSLLVIISLKK